MFQILKWLLLAGVVGAGVYGYLSNPKECARLEADVQFDMTEIFHDGQALRAKGQSEWPRVPETLGRLVQHVAKDVPRIFSPPQPWKAPDVMPEKPDWMWTTVRGDTFQNVKVVGMEPDSVMITYLGGGRSVPLADLPPSLQQELGYEVSPAALQAEAVQPKPSQASPQTQPQLPSGEWQFDDFERGLAQSHASGKRLLLLFTGSDWCPCCQQLEHDYLSTPEFQRFAAQNFIMVTLDFPRHSPQSEELKSQNESMAQKYNITAFPTLVTLDSNQQPAATLVGCPPTLNGLMTALQGGSQ